ncbi:MAG: hypothetical protein BGO12_10440 [Verrucomicrobia bacterium 61-8]|nr:MAG: hypothetical protein BGO12_10440 [Verrucomicrobia bacterium 61-8]
MACGEVPPGKKSAFQWPFSGGSQGARDSKARLTGKPSTWMRSDGTPSCWSTFAVCSSATMEPSQGCRYHAELIIVESVMMVKSGVLSAGFFLRILLMR